MVEDVTSESSDDFDKVSNNIYFDKILGTYFGQLDLVKCNENLAYLSHF